MDPIVHLAQKKHGEHTDVPPENDVYFLPQLLRKHPPTPPRAEMSRDDERKLILQKFYGSKPIFGKDAKE